MPKCLAIEYNTCTCIQLYSIFLLYMYTYMYVCVHMAKHMCILKQFTFTVSSHEKFDQGKFPDT